MKSNLLILIISVLFFSCQQKNTEIPLPEHPRPDFERSTWMNLNGQWKFASDTENIGETENWQNSGEFFDQKILVPFSWASPLSGIQEPNVHIGWYYREYNISDPENWTDKNTWLIFGASDFHTKVWINSKLVGEHKGGYIPFDFNISEFLTEGTNEIAVRVEDEELDNRPSGKQYYGNAKGIWQTVYLEARNKNFISSIKFTPDIDTKEIKVKVKLSEEINQAAEFRLFNKNDSIDYKGIINAGNKKGEFTFPIENMRLWTLDDPYLYEVKAAVKGTGFTDEVSTYFGMRKISAIPIEGEDFQYVALNNEPLYMKMALDQSYHPEGFYTFPSDLFMKEEIQRAKDLGLNGLRIHIKAEIPRKLYWADKLGLLIQEDVPNFWGEPTDEAKANWEYIAEKEIERDYNHPSIFSWVLFNETWGLFSTNEEGRRYYSPETQGWVKEWYYKTKEYDSTRLVEDNSPCNWDHVITDINTWHRYSPARHWAGFLDEMVENTYPGSTHNYIGGNKQGNEPMFNSECGAVWGYDGSTGDIDLTWEYHIMMNEFRKRPKIAGFLFTEFHDVINEWNGYYRFDRSNKMFGLDELCPGMTMKDFHKDLYVVAGDNFFQEFKGGSQVEIPVGISVVTNNFPDNLKINYSVYGWDELGEKFEHTSGDIEATASPFTYTQLSPVSLQLPDKNAVMIFATKLISGSGEVLQQNFIPFKVISDIDQPNTITKAPDEFSNASWSAKHLAPQNGNKVWGMGSGFFEYEFDLPTGLESAEIENIEFRAELASRYPQGKYLEEGDAEGIGMTIVSEKGIDPGYGKNSYPQTDEKQHASVVKITANDQRIAEIELPDDPADHTGILSWMNQVPGWEWGSDDQSKPWLLDEAGSYGYLVVAELDETSKKSALKTGKVTIRLYVDESTVNRGGLSIYGKDSGRYPMDLTLVVYKK
ncbi:MAG: glycoside hydrolase family 2 [Mariniphaga sp.]|nr:glycoside hydrolase family 2 [Mariniphaga sp.]